MEFNYDSYLLNFPPGDPTETSRAMGRVSRSPWSYKGAYGDIMRSKGAENAALYGLNAAKANNDYALQEQQARNQLALGGLQMLTNQQQNDLNLANTRTGMTTGIFNSLLSGLFG